MVGPVVASQETGNLTVPSLAPQGITGPGKANPWKRGHSFPDLSPQRLSCLGEANCQRSGSAAMD